MLNTRPLILATGLAVALAAIARTSQAQPPGGGGMIGMGGQASPSMVLLSPSVQKELKLTDEQKGKAYNLAKFSGQKNRDLQQTIAYAGPNANPQMMMEAARKIRQETDQAIAKILDAKQKERLDQIVLQVEGPLAVARPEIAAKLRLNDNQNEYVQTVIMQMRRELFMTIRQGAANGQLDPSQTRAVSTRLRASAVQEIGKFIDRKQKAAFNKMQGEPFDITKIETETASADLGPPPANPAAPPTSASAPANPAAPAAPAAPAESAEAKDAADPAPEKETTKAPTQPAPRKKGRAKAGSNP